MAYLVNRLMSVALTLFLISIVTFGITNILPGDVAMMIMGTQSNPEALEGLRQSLGLNDPLLVQYGRWIGGMLSGNWGESLLFNEPIAPLIAQKVLASGLIVVMTIDDGARVRDPAGRLGRAATATAGRTRPPRRLRFWASACRTSSSGSC